MSFNLLDEHSPKSKQPKLLSISLKPHQLALIHALREIEKSGKIIIEPEKIFVKPEVPAEPVQVQPVQDDPTMDYIYEQQEAYREQQRLEDIQKAMVKLSTKIYNYYTGEEEEENQNAIMELKTMCIILGSRLGSGKTYVILGLLAMLKKPAIHNRIIQGTSYYSLEMENNRTPVNCNLIIVPHGLFKQWQGFMKKAKVNKYYMNSLKDLEPFYKSYELEGEERYNTPKEDTYKDKGIHYRIEIRKKKFNKLLNECDILLVNFSRYNLFKLVFKKVFWNRLIVDEAHDVKMGDSFQEFGAFNIFVTATPEKILKVPKRRYVSQLFGTDVNIFPYFTVSATEEFINQSMEVPKAHVYFIEGRLPMMLQQFGDHIPEEAMAMINAGNYKEAINKLNCDVDTDENIFQILKKQTKDKIHNLKLDKENLEGRRMDDEEKKIQMDKINEQIITAVDKLADLKDRMSAINEACCIICYEEMKVPSITNCCQQIYCLHCLTQSAKNQAKCPNCRHYMSNKDFKVIDNNAVSSKKKEKKQGEFVDLDKVDILEKLLTYIVKNYDTPRILIFSDYPETFEKLITMIAKLGIHFKTIEGTPTHIQNVITDYDEGRINVVLLNSKKYAAGHNLQSTDFLISFHRIDKFDEEQVIGRAHRYGRKNPLKVFYLVNANESKHSHLRRTTIPLLDKSDFRLIKEDVADSDVEDDIEEDEEPKKKKKGKKGKKDIE